MRCVSRRPLIMLGGALLLALPLALVRPVVHAQTLAVGSHGNAWSAATVGVAGTSTALDTNRCQSGYSSAFGNTSTSSTLTVQYSQDNTNFYSSASTVAANGNFALAFTHGARYVRLLSSAAATITATLACK